MEGRGAPVLRGGDFEFSLDYNQIKEGCGGAGVGVWGVGGGALLCGPWAVRGVGTRLQFVLKCSSACGCRERLVLFLPPVIPSPGGELRRVN